MTGFVTFRIGDREYATPLDEVREVVRLTGLSRLPGMSGVEAGVVELRGTPLPVLDLRVATPDGSAADSGDVLVLIDAAGTVIGVAVDAVVAVRGVDELAASDDVRATVGLPGYVVDVLRDQNDGRAVLRVDLRRMLELAA